MKAEDWLEKWRIQQIGFHQDAVHTDLVREAPTFLDGGPHRILVPLCGKTLDLDWLVRQGHEVVGIELSSIAAQAVFTESGRSFEIRHQDGLEIYEGHGLTVVCGDLFRVEPAHVGQPDRVWDRAAMVALSPETRSAYAAKIRELAAPGQVLMNAFAYDQRLRDGPPWSLPEDQVRAHYDNVEILHQEDQVDSIRQAWRDLGITSWITTTYLITLE